MYTIVVFLFDIFCLWCMFSVHGACVCFFGLDFFGRATSFFRMTLIEDVVFDYDATKVTLILADGNIVNVL